jgi:hypothetical protein
VGAEIGLSLLREVQRLRVFEEETKQQGDVRFEVFIAVKIQVEVFWVVMVCSVRVGYQCFGGPCCLHLHGEVSQCLQNVGILLQDFMLSQCRRL